MIPDDPDKEGDDSINYDIQPSGDIISMKSVASLTSMTSRKKETKKLSWTKRGLGLVADQWFILALGVVITIASQVQVPQSRQKLKSTIVSYAAVSIIL
jgi:sodium/bile acid cotransporter 7